MDTKSTLEQLSNSYNSLIAISVFFLALICLLFFTNKKGFNKSFGYEIFLTGPILILVGFLIKELYAFKIDPTSSWLSSFSQSKENWFFPVFSLLIVFIGIIAFFMMLYIGGIFSDNPPENNIPMLINFMIIVSFLVIAGYIYKYIQDKDTKLLFSQTKAMRDLFDLRTKNINK